MKTSNLFLLFGLLLSLLLVSSACGTGLNTGDAEPTPTPTSTPTSTPAISSGSNSSNMDNPDVDQPPLEDDEDDPEATALPVDSCLIGTWEVEQESFRSYLIQAMNVSDQAQFEFGEIEGSFEMVIDEETMAYTTTDPLKIPLKLIANGIELTAMEMEVAGAGGAFYVTYEDLFIVYGQDYDFFGNGIADFLNAGSLGQGIVSVTLTPDLFISTASFTNVDISPVLAIYPQIENYAVATYTCSGDVFTYQFGEYEAVWLRK